MQPLSSVVDCETNNSAMLTPHVEISFTHGDSREAQ